jgi:hypothetical protein
MGLFNKPLKSVKSFLNSSVNSVIPLRQPDRFISSTVHSGLPFLPGLRKAAARYERSGSKGSLARPADHNSQNNAAVIPQKSAQFLSNEQLSQKLRNRLAADSLALNNSNYPAYKGEMVAPESALTQRARSLRQEDINKPLPYSKKIGTMLNKEATGFSPEQSRALLDIIGRGGQDQNEVLNRLQKQFGKNYGYENERAARLQDKIGRDVGRAEKNTISNFERLNNEFKDVENRRNMDVARAFHDAGLQKSGKRNALINQLEDFGQQDYALRNMQNMAKRDAFDEEVQMPGRKIAIASKALNALGNAEDHPSLLEARNKELQRIQNAYNAPHMNYPGQRVIGMQPESQQAMSNALSLSPNYRDSYYAQRKDIERNALNNSLPDQAFNAIPGAVNPLMENLDYLTKQQLKKQSKEIAGKHVRLGSYGSGAHKAETERSLREILNRVRQEREGALTGVTKGETSLATRREQTGLTKHRMMDMLGFQEFGNLLDRNNQLNNIGFNKRSHKQAEENAALREWYAQLQHSMEGANPGAYSNLAKQYNTNVPSLFNRPQAYNNNLQAFNQYKNTTKQGLTDPVSRKQLEEWEEQQRQSLMGGGYSPQYGSYDNLKSQALALARATPVF